VCIQRKHKVCRHKTNSTTPVSSTGETQGSDGELGDPCETDMSVIVPTLGCGPPAVSSSEFSAGRQISGTFIQIQGARVKQEMSDQSQESHRREE
jgi:hypothetical protein